MPADIPKVLTIEQNGATTLRLPDNVVHELRDVLAAAGTVSDGVWYLLRLLSYAHGEAH